MGEDLIQAIFLQYVGVKWSVFFKDAFSSFRRTRSVWKSPRSAVPLMDIKRREFFLNRYNHYDYRSSVQFTRERIYRRAYFVSQLLDDVFQTRHHEEGEEEADISVQGRRSKHAARKSKPVGDVLLCSWGGKEKDESEEDMGFGLFDGSDYDPDEHYNDGFGASFLNPANQMQAKQNLLLLLSADILLNTRLHGEITCFRSQYESWNANLPHATIVAVLKFLGVSEKWISFFQRFLSAPLKFVDDVDAGSRVRKRGTPDSHVLSEVFGETLLFCLDFMVNQVTNGQILWRVGEDLWFWSPDQQVCVAAWQVIQKFSEIMGVTASVSKSGSARITRDKAGTALDIHPELPGGVIRWGMLYLNPVSGRFEIDRDMVKGHIGDLKHQLQSKQRSIFGWIQAWNSYATRFFTSNFGKPANCFGRQHVDDMLHTHRQVQRQIFSLETEDAQGDASVVAYLQKTIGWRFGNGGIPDGYFFLPIDLGGLELSSPFIELVGQRDSVVAEPDTLLDEFFEAERDEYAALKRAFETMDPDRIAARNKKFYPLDGDKFMSFEEYIRYRELLNYGFSGQLVEVYDKLLKHPEQEPIECDPNGAVYRALNQLSDQHNLTGIRSNWDEMSAYWKWVAQLYGPEIVERFGGFNIVDPGLLPIGLVSLFRDGRVAWRDE